MLINSLSEIFGSRIKVQEIILLLHDAKEVVRQGFYEEELPKVEQFCKNKSIFLIKSKFKVLIEDKENKFSNKGLRISTEDSRNGMYFIYLSKDEQKALLASYAELLNEHKELGYQLGYPECCVDFFCQNFSANNANLELKPTNPWTNLSKRAQDCVLLSHFPCNSECKKSIELAKKYFKIIENVDGKWAQELFNALNI